MSMPVSTCFRTHSATALFTRASYAALSEAERAAEAGRVAGWEEVLGRRGARLAGAAHLLRHGEIAFPHAVAGLGVAVAPAGGGRGCGKEGLDFVHAGLRKKAGFRLGRGNPLPSASRRRKACSSTRRNGTACSARSRRPAR